VREGICRVATNTAAAMGATATVAFDDVNYGYPATVNSATEAEQFKLAAVVSAGP
jgi:hypothetical protein